MLRLGHKSGGENSNMEAGKETTTREEVSDYYYGYGVVVVMFSLVNSLSL